VKHLVWVPSRPVEMTEPLWRIVNWAQGMDPGKGFDLNDFEWEHRKHQVLLLGDVKSTALSMSRSAGIHIAKTLDVDWFHMVDCDNPAGIPLDRYVGFLNQASAMRFGLMVSPAIAKKGSVGVVQPDGSSFGQLESVPLGKPFDIGGGTGGLMSMSKACLEKLEPVGQFDWKNPDGTTRQIPMFYRWSETGTGKGSQAVSEDYALCQHVHAVTGFRVGADTRLKTFHYKPWAMGSFDEDVLRGYRQGFG